MKNDKRQIIDFLIKTKNAESKGIFTPYTEKAPSDMSCTICGASSLEYICYPVLPGNPFIKCLSCNHRESQITRISKLILIIEKIEN